LVTALETAADALGVSIRKGTVWSTDACYRETREQVAKHRDAGVLGVEFETAGVLAFGQYRRLRTANLLVVSDELRENWRPGFTDTRHFDSTLKGLDILYEAAVRLSERSS
jgi:purine-nucleoside phosphorylase